MAKKSAPPAPAAGLDETLAGIERRYGAGVVTRLGRGYVHVGAQAVPTGSFGFDRATGVGGFPRGRISEIFGPESSGKTSLALHAIARAQAAGGTAALIDAEHALDPGYARRLGVDLKELLVAQPDSGEEALEITDLLVRSNAVDCVVVDSVAALVPKAELAGDMGDAHMGLQARLMSQALRKLTGAIRKSCAAVIFINQLRMRIGVFFGNPETTTGGRALKFYASLRVDVRRVGVLKDGDTPVGTRVRAKIVKNKVAPPFREAEFDLTFARGIDRAAELLDWGVSSGVVAKAGAWLVWGDAKLGQGRAKAAAALRENPEQAAALRDAVTAALDADAPQPPGNA